MREGMMVRVGVVSITVLSDSSKHYSGWKGRDSSAQLSSALYMNVVSLCTEKSISWYGRATLILCPPPGEFDPHAFFKQILIGFLRWLKLAPIHPSCDALQSDRFVVGVIYSQESLPSISQFDFRSSSPGEAKELATLLEVSTWPEVHMIPTILGSARVSPTKQSSCLSNGFPPIRGTKLPYHRSTQSTCISSPTPRFRRQIARGGHLVCACTLWAVAIRLWSD